MMMIEPQIFTHTECMMFLTELLIFFFLAYLD